LGLIVDFNEGWNSQRRIEIDAAIRECLAQPPDGENWRVSLVAGFAPSYCEVRVKTPNQTRSRLFFEDPPSLAKAVTQWLRLYRLR
jgi:hypothetical protein